MRVRLALLAVFCAALAVAIKAAGQGTSTTPDSASPRLPSEPIYTRHSLFQIPFRFDPADLARIDAAGIRLLVSTDGGRNWAAAQTVAPEAGSFTFRADRDGSYLFAVQTIDRAGQAYPSQLRAETALAVVVDSESPQLHLQASGGRQVRWEINDANASLETLRLEYREARATSWQPLAVTASARGTASVPAAVTGTVLVRGHVADLAGNVGIAPELPLTGEPAPATPGTIAGVPGSSPGSVGNPQGVGSGSTLGAPTSFVPEGDDPFGRNLSGVGDPFLAGPPADPARRPLPLEESSPQGRSGPLPAPALTADPAPAARSAAPLFPDAAARVGEQPESRLPLTGTQPSEGFVVPDGNTSYANSTRFTIAYEVEQVGLSGVGDVELWMTEDMGRTWRRYGSDPDRRSPLEIDVPGEGLYGFTLVARSGVGLGGAPPQPGERPQMQVRVDSRPPRLEVLPPAQGQAGELNRVTIRWIADDENLGERPISLFYGASPSGPWEPIAAGIVNTGNYVWTATPDLRWTSGPIPSTLYVRVEARDLAGNALAATSAQPITLDLSQPSTRILGISSAR